MSSLKVCLPKSVRYANSLPAALRHYEIELTETLVRLDVEAIRDSRLPSIEGLRGLDKWRSLVGTIRFSDRFLDESSDPFLQLWPSLGLYESLFWRSKLTRSAIIYHDPVPLRPQFGYGKIAHLAGRLSRIGNTPTIVAHSEDADVELAHIFSTSSRASVLHPILSRQELSVRDSDVILVAGQFKPVRDIAILEVLGPALRKLGFRPRIIGRGWPTEIQGWEVQDLFVREERLNELLASARAVILPYRRYFQSGIAIRALEMGTIAVGPETSFTRVLFGAQSPAIVRFPDEVNDWLRAIETVNSSLVDPQDVFDSYVGRCDASWRSLIGLLCHVCCS